jgi:hypothetical protein
MAIRARARTRARARSLTSPIASTRFVSTPAAPRAARRARDDRLATSLNPKDKPERPTTVISTSAWPRRSLSTPFAREEKSHTATRSRLSAPRPPTPFLVLAILPLLEIMVPFEISPRVTIVPGPHRDRVLVEMTLQTLSFLLQRRPRRRSLAPDDRLVRLP